MHVYILQMQKIMLYDSFSSLEIDGVILIKV